jgi:hypothetical protein
MSKLVNFILAFYPATLVWLMIPQSFFDYFEGNKKLTGAATSNAALMTFGIRLIAYAILFFLAYRIISKFVSRGFYSSRNFISIVLGILSIIILASIIFFELLPGETIYKAPEIISDYILKQPFTFFAALIPLVYLYFE